MKNPKERLRDLVHKLRNEAILHEKQNEREFKSEGLDKKAREIIADKQYWNGYLDALNNVLKEFK